jgi:hypothetical protein
MIEMVASALLCLATLTGVLALLSVLVRRQVRAFNAAVATDRLDAWERHLDALDTGERDRAQATPPAEVLDAMLDLPAWGRRSLVRRR